MLVSIIHVFHCSSSSDSDIITAVHAVQYNKLLYCSHVTAVATCIYCRHSLQLIFCVIHCSVQCSVIFCYILQTCFTAVHAVQCYILLHIVDMFHCMQCSVIYCRHVSLQFMLCSIVVIIMTMAYPFMMYTVHAEDPNNNYTCSTVDFLCVFRVCMKDNGSTSHTNFICTLVHEVLTYMYMYTCIYMYSMYTGIIIVYVWHAEYLAVWMIYSYVFVCMHAAGSTQTFLGVRFCASIN